MGNLANIPPTWETEITQLETTDPVEGGPTGIDNQPHRQLASRTAWLKAAVEAVSASIAGLAAKVHRHVLGEVEGLDEALGARSSVGHGHEIADVATLQDALDARHKLSGNETHQGKFKVTGAPTDALDVLRKMDINALLASEIMLGPGSTQDSGYAFLGSLTLAWVRGPSVWFSSTTNPEMQLQTPITFSSVYTYALSTENAEYPVTDNDAWFQMVRAVPSGNLFPVVAQAVGGDRAGWIRPVLWVLGATTAHTPTITTEPWTGMVANGQVFPKIVNLQLAASGCLGATTWEIVSGGTATASFLDGYPSIVQVSFPAVGAYTLSVKATDSTGATTTKTLTLTLSAYAQTPLVISTGNRTLTADSYPWTVSVPLTSTGGDAPITWSLVPGSNTTLPSAAVSGSSLTGSVPAAGTYTAEVRATDSSSTPQLISKTLSIVVKTYVEPVDPDNCFEADSTYVLMADGHGKLFADVRPGDMVLGVKDRAHERGLRCPQPTMVLDLSRVEAGSESASTLIHGVKSTPGHVYASVEGPRGGWHRASDLAPTDLLVTLGEGSTMATLPAGAPEAGDPVRVAMDLGNQLHTYFVGRTASGPWLLVHNMAVLQC